MKLEKIARKILNVTGVIIVITISYLIVKGIIYLTAWWMFEIRLRPCHKIYAQVFAQVF